MCDVNHPYFDFHSDLSTCVVLKDQNSIQSIELRSDVEPRPWSWFSTVGVYVNLENSRGSRDFGLFLMYYSATHVPYRATSIANVDIFRLKNVS